LAASRIVVGVDGSNGARSALLWAADECRIRGASLFVVHAPDPVDASMVGINGEAALRSIDDVGARMLSELVALASARQPGVPVASLLSHAHAADALIALSAEADVLVVGTRGRASFAASMLGSVSHRVAAHCQCPLVIASQQAVSGRSSTRRDLAVGVSQSSAGLAALEFAFQEASLRGAALIAVRAWGDPEQSRDDGSRPATDDAGPTAVKSPRTVEESSSSIGESGRKAAGSLPVTQNLHIQTGDSRSGTDDQARQRATRILQRDLDRLSRRYPRVEVAAKLQRTSPADALLNAARQAELVVVGCHHSDDPRSSQLGAVPAAIVYRAECPVAVIRRRHSRYRGAPEEDLAHLRFARTGSTIDYA